MSGDWTQYFSRYTRMIDGKNVEYYEYKDSGVTTLPANLPMPPTDTLYNMFYQCSRLQDITALANWDVSNVKDMHWMFMQCYQLKDISALANWDVSNVKDMSYMFHCCDRLQNISALANWDVSNVENIQYMFAFCEQLQDITALANWDISNVKNMRGMFRGCDQLKDISALANWDVSNVKNMRYMFLCCEQLSVYGHEAMSEASDASDEEEDYVYDDTDDIKSSLDNLLKQNHTQLLCSLWERVKPLLKDTTKLNGYFKQHIHIEDLPSDWQNTGLVLWNP